MDREEIKNVIPHRDNMLLVDEVESIDGVAYGKYKVRDDEFFLKGHFPNNPIVPGVILCEILAQSACVLLQNAIGPGEIPVYTGLDQVRFRNVVKPGDLIETRCEITRKKVPFYFAKGKAMVNGKVCVTAEFSFAVTKE